MYPPMSAVKKPVSRRERARTTRRLIVRAAHEEFCTSGYHGATMAGIAKRAGVAVQTVYFVFHTKGELLRKVFDTAVLGEGEPVVPEEMPWYRALLTDADAHRALRGFVAGTGTIAARVAPLAEVVRAAATTDPDASALLADREALRVAGYRTVTGALEDRGALRAGVDAATAADILLGLTGAEVYLAFVRDRGWSHERFVDWTGTALAELLLAP